MTSPVTGLCPHWLGLAFLSIPFLLHILEHFFDLVIMLCLKPSCPLLLLMMISCGNPGVTFYFLLVVCGDFFLLHQFFFSLVIYVFSESSVIIKVDSFRPICSTTFWVSLVSCLMDNSSLTYPRLNSFSFLLPGLPPRHPPPHCALHPEESTQKPLNQVPLDSFPGTFFFTYSLHTHS